jgi:hypothetical protein
LWAMTTQDVKMKHELIQVRYGSGREGSVDDITLNELILSHNIGQFYRPSQERWINYSDILAIIFLVGRIGIGLDFFIPNFKS